MACRWGCMTQKFMLEYHNIQNMALETKKKRIPNKHITRIKKLSQAIICNLGLHLLWLGISSLSRGKCFSSICHPGAICRNHFGSSWKFPQFHIFHTLAAVGCFHTSTFSTLWQQLEVSTLPHFPHLLALCCSLLR